MICTAIVRFGGGLWSIRRRYHASKSVRVRWALAALYGRALAEKGSWISIDAEFASVPYFPHGPYGVFVSGAASIGHSCVIFHQVTIGSNTLIDSARCGAPKIGNNCYIGAGAKIVGGIIVGNNVRVGANTVVVKNVPDNCVVVSGDQRVIPAHQPLDNRFFNRAGKTWRYWSDGKWCAVTDPATISLLDARFRRMPA